MLNYLPFGEIPSRPGLRIVLVQGMPSPWGQAAKTILEIKGIEYAAAPWKPYQENADIQAWSGEASAPIVAWNDEKPVHRWIDILQLAERLQPEPALVPEDVTERALMLGLSQEICGRKGLGWNRRLQMVAPGYGIDVDPITTRFGDKYGFDARDAGLAGARIAATLRALTTQLRRQYDRGVPFFVGGQLSALDIYWTAFANLLDPLPDENLPLPDQVRPAFVATDPLIIEALDPLLLEHRKKTFDACFRTPMEM